MADKCGSVRYSPHADRMAKEEKERASRIQGVHVASLYF